MLLLLAASALSAELYLEREILRLADERCRLLSPSVHVGVAVGARQAETALREAGASLEQLQALNSQAVQAGDALPCDNAALVDAARRAEQAYRGWINQWQIEFPGIERPWVARRATDRDGFVLWQSGQDFRFGVRQGETGARLTLVAPPGDWRVAALSLRDPASPAPSRALKRVLAPSSVTATSFLANGRQLVEGNWRFTFDPLVALEIARLSPQEGVAIQLTSRTGVQRQLLVEAGDFASALTLIEAQGRRLQ